MNEQEKKPNNPQAFPLDANSNHLKECRGMTLRDYFANSALQGILSNADTMRELTKAYERGKKSFSFQECLADLSLSYADAMLKQREL
jgi:hypothetical protein